MRGSEREEMEREKKMGLGRTRGRGVTEEWVVLDQNYIQTERERDRERERERENKTDETHYDQNQAIANCISKNPWNGNDRGERVRDS